MRVSFAHSGYIAQKIAIELANRSAVKIIKTIDDVSKIAKSIIDENIRWEHSIEEKANQMIEIDVQLQKERTIEFDHINEKEIFRMIKRKIAKDEDFPLNFEDRFEEVSYTILDTLVDESMITFTAPENVIKNIIFDSIQDYLNSKVLIEDIVAKKIKRFKRKLIPGTEDYDQVYQQLFEIELKARSLK
jgi:hypothetical protein